MLGGMTTDSRARVRQAVLFDLDGTLVDSETNYFEAGRELLAGQGVDGFSWEDHLWSVGVSTRETVTHWKERYALGPSVDDLLAEKNRRYLELARTNTRTYPEMRRFVELLHGAGVPMAVASGSSRAAIDAILDGTGLGGFMTATVSADEVPAGKPAPDVFLEAARRLGAPAAGCVVLEDAVPGVLAAHAAGMRCIAVPFLKEQADDPAFVAAELLFPGGQAEFTATAAYSWLTGGG